MAIAQEICRGRRICEPPVGMIPQRTSPNPKGCVFCGNPDVGTLEKFHSSRNAKAVDGSDDRFEDVGEGSLGVIFIAHLVAGLQHRNGFFEIHTGREPAEKALSPLAVRIATHTSRDRR